MNDSDDSPVNKRRKLENTSDLETSPSLTDFEQDDSSLPKVQDCKIFNDPIHGSIQLHPLLVKIIDTTQFQRLRRLKQLGVSYYVYPSACHQRFEHSIGTCYLAGELLTRLCQGQPELKITEQDVLCVQIAALCHDLGHGPFSHLFEDVLAELRPGINWKHEEASIKMFDYMIKDNNLMKDFNAQGLKDIDITFIKELIYGQLTTQENDQVFFQNVKWPYVGRDINKSFLYEIVSNKLTGIDVDKFDYFARDSYYLGHKISFDHKRFFHFYRVIQVEDGKHHLCLRDKEVNTCYEIYRVRDTLHRRAYQHPVVKVFETMIKDALCKANDYLLFRNIHGERNVQLAYTVDDMYTFNQADDCVITLIKQSDNPKMIEAQQIIDKIERRDIYRFIGDTHVNFKTEAEKKQCKNSLDDIIRHCQFDEKVCSLTAHDLYLQIIELTCGNRGEDPIRNMWFYTKQYPNKATKISKEQVSTFLPQTFSEFDVRLYCKIRDPKICSMLRYGFKNFCNEKSYTAPKGSDQWMIPSTTAVGKSVSQFNPSSQDIELKKSATL